MQEHDAVPVLYIAGAGRSGSTLLELVLGTGSSFCPAGELTFLWDRGVRDNQLCGCGRSFHECPFWQRVGDHAFGGWDGVDLNEILRLRRALERYRSWPWLALSRGPSRIRSAIESYAGYLEPVYRAIRVVSGRQIVIDSSKSPSRAFLLAALRGIDLRVIHLVRNPCGVAHSWAKTNVRRPEVTSHVAYMAPVSPAYSALVWSGFNAPFEVARFGGPVRAIMLYDDFARGPEPVLRRCLEQLGLAPLAHSVSFQDGRTVSIGPTHTVAGNPLRFRQGDLTVRPDEEWRGMPSSARAAVSAIAGPLWVGYRLTATSQRGAGMRRVEAMREVSAASIGPSTHRGAGTEFVQNRSR